MTDTELGELLTDIQVNVCPVAFDQLMQFEAADLQTREETLEKSVALFATRLEALKKRVETDEKVYAFLVAEHEKATTALKVKRDELVRIVCPICKGTGMRTADVLSGKIRGTAFEGTGAGASSVVRSMEVDPMNVCSTCEGKRWQLMLRFKG